jgi:transposase
MPSPAELIASPYDSEARYSNKQSVEWMGYKVHLTETCDENTAASHRQCRDHARDHSG